MRHAITSRQTRGASLRREAILLRLAIASTGEALEHTQHSCVSSRPHQAQARTTPRVARGRAPDELCLSCACRCVCVCVCVCACVCVGVGVCAGYLWVSVSCRITSNKRQEGRPATLHESMNQRNSAKLMSAELSTSSA